MNITILGGGKFGYSIAEQLSAEDHDVVIIDNSKVLLDESVASITSKLQFVENATAAEAKSAIYSQPSVTGYSIVAPSNGGDETEINLETLFNATLGNRDKITEIFNAK